MTYAPAPLTALAAYWEANGGKALGIVGNTAHRSGYHLGRDRIFGSGGLGWEDYSVQLPRDRRGLTNAASAIDLGRLNGSLRELQAFSRWLVSQCLAHGPGYEDVREIIYSPDGTAVQRWSGVDGQIHTGQGNGDTSHRTHTHISYFRDSQRSAKVPLFEPYFLTPPDSSTGDEMQTFKVPEQRTFAKLPKGANLYDNSALAGNGNTINLDPGREFVLIGWYSTGVAIIAYEPPREDPGSKSKAMFVKASDIVSQRVEKPYTKADLTAAGNAGWNEGRAAVLDAGSAVPKR